MKSSRWKSPANSTAAGREWIAEADKPSGVWYRTLTYNMILIACNTGMRPTEMKNLCWRDIMPARDREGREIVVLFVQGKGRSQPSAHYNEAPAITLTTPRRSSV